MEGQREQRDQREVHGGTERVKKGMVEKNIKRHFVYLEKN